MDELKVYLQVGIEHITDYPFFEAYDHALFLLVLCLPFVLKDWKKVTLLVTAFTIGHAATIVLSTTNLVTIQSDIVEFLIPVTIFLTAIYNIWKPNQARENLKYALLVALFFGLIHGLGFSNYLKELMGSEGDIVIPLIGFNLGVELGQLIIVFIVLILNTLVLRVLNQNVYIRVLSILIVILSIILMFQTKFW